MWEGEVFDVVEEDYAAELEGLDLLINLWTRRDIRFHVLPRSITDAKRRVSSERTQARAHAVDQIAAALTLDIWSDLDDDEEAGTSSTGRLPADQLPLFDSTQSGGRHDLGRALASLPNGEDRHLVREVLARRAHVFLTRDRKVLRCSAALRPYGLLLASPLDLLEELVACGAMLAVMRPETMYWPLPDLQRVSHLISALGGT